MEEEIVYVSATTYFDNELDISFNKKLIWSKDEKRDIMSMLYDAYHRGGMFYWKLNNEYNIIHVVKEVHTTEAGRHFNIVLCNNTSIVTKPRDPVTTVTTTLHCRVCYDKGMPYISKFSEIVEWL